MPVVLGLHGGGIRYRRVIPLSQVRDYIVWGSHMSKATRVPTAVYHYIGLSCVSFCVFMTCSPAVVHAIEDELTVGASPVYSNLPTEGEGQSGLGGAFYLEYQLSDFWGLSAGVADAYHRSDSKHELPGRNVVSAWIGARYNLDIATYVPFASLSVTGYNASVALRDEEDNVASAGIKFGLGMDYRKWRSFSVGVETNLHAYSSDLQNYPVYVTTLIRLNYHISLY